METTQKERKAKSNNLRIYRTLNIKLKLFLNIYFAVLLFKIVFAKESKTILRKLDFDSRINIKIKGVGNQPILNKKFRYKPYKIYVLNNILI